MCTLKINTISLTKYYITNYLSTEQDKIFHSFQHTVPCYVPITLQLHPKHKHFPTLKYFQFKETRTIMSLNSTHMVNNANLFSVDNHVNQVCNFAFPLLCRLRQANNWIILLQNPHVTRSEAKQISQSKNDINHIQNKLIPRL